MSKLSKLVVGATALWSLAAASDFLDSGASILPDDKIDLRLPSVVSPHYGLHVFALGKNGSVFHKFQTGAVDAKTKTAPMSRWYCLTPNASNVWGNDPAVALNEDGHIELFVGRTADSLDLWQMYQTDAKNPLAWSTPRGPTCMCTAVSPTACPWCMNCNDRHECYSNYWLDHAPFTTGDPELWLDPADKKLTLFFRNFDGHIYSLKQTSPNNSTVWTTAGGVEYGIFEGGARKQLRGELPPLQWNNSVLPNNIVNLRFAMAHNPNYGMHVFALGVNGSIWHQFQTGKIDNETIPTAPMSGWRCLTPDTSFVGANDPRVFVGKAGGLHLLIAKEGAKKGASSREIWQAYQTDPKNPIAWSMGPLSEWPLELMAWAGSSNVTTTSDLEALFDPAAGVGKIFFRNEDGALVGLSQSEGNAWSQLVHYGNLESALTELMI